MCVVSCCRRRQGVNFFLVGMPGSGKTTVGRMLAQGLGYRWIDVDQHIEAVRAARPWAPVKAAVGLTGLEV